MQMFSYYSYIYTLHDVIYFEEPTNKFVSFHYSYVTVKNS